MRNVGEGVARADRLRARAEGPFADFYDFCERVDPTVLNKRTIESLIKAGAFDSLGHPRKGLLQVFEPIVDATLRRRRERDAGHDEPVRPRRRRGRRRRRCSTTGSPIPDVEFDKSEQLRAEKEMLGLYVSDHPLMGAERGAAPARRVLDRRARRARRRHRCAPSRASSPRLQRKYTKRGDLMATFVLEDLAAAIEVMVFPKTMLQYGELLDPDAIVTVKGRVDGREDTTKLMAMEITRPEMHIDGGPPVRAAGQGRRARRRTCRQAARDPARASRATARCSCTCVGPEKETVLRLGDEFRCDARNGLFAELRVLFGADCIA